MSLHINMEQIGDVAVLQCTGSMVRAQALCSLKDAVTKLSESRVIVLDISEVNRLDGGGLGMLVFLHNWASARGIQLKLVNPSKLARELLKRTGLESVLHVSSVDDVIEIYCNADRIIENVDRAVA